MRFSSAAVRTSGREYTLLNVDVLYRKSSLDEFRIESMKSASERREIKGEDKFLSYHTCHYKLLYNKLIVCHGF